MFVDVVVAVPADVGALVDHQRGETQAGAGLLWDLKFKRNLKRKQYRTQNKVKNCVHLLSNNRTGKAGTNNHQVVLFFQPVETPVKYQSFLKSIDSQ